MSQADKPKLTPRERQIAGYVLNGSANKVIAIELGISLRTVEAHRARIFHKFGVRHAVAFAHLFYRLKEPDLLDSYLSAQARSLPGAQPSCLLHESVAVYACAQPPQSGDTVSVSATAAAQRGDQPQLPGAAGAPSIGSRSG